MSIDVTIDSRDLQRLHNALRRFPGQVAPFIRRAGEASAFKIMREAKPLTPVDTGRLRDSIGISLGVQNQGLTSIIQTNVKYAGIVHEGTGRGKNSKKRPFMRQGVDNSLTYIENAYKNEIDKALKLMKSQV